MTSMVADGCIDVHAFLGVRPFPSCCSKDTCCVSSRKRLMMMVIMDVYTPLEDDGDRDDAKHR